MKHTDFKKSSSGSLVRTAQGNWAFLPNALPPTIAWDSELANALAKAAAAVASLAQATREVHSPYLINGISNVLATREAQLSSQIENIHTTTADLFVYQEQLFGDEEPEALEDTIEVNNYLEALNVGLAQLRDPKGLPLSNRLICHLHGILLKGARGASKQSGAFRKAQVMLGGTSEADALYVPPPPLEMRQALHAMEAFMHAPEHAGLHSLIRAGLLHYQFEAIHPFLDGNGRMGRLLIILSLCSDRSLDEPLIYPSAFFEEHRQEYYERLLKVSSAGDWYGWLRFFLQGMEQQALQALQRYSALEELRSDYKAGLTEQRAPTQLFETLDLLFGQPALSAKWLATRLGLSPPTVHRYLKVLQEHGIVTARDERQRNRIYVAQDIIRIVEGA